MNRLQNDCLKPQTAKLPDDQISWMAETLSFGIWDLGIIQMDSFFVSRKGVVCGWYKQE